ncbi:MAG TPA: hypothetical protein VJC37_07135 [Planctomycetota bacterium]|nr:hypothetical protein [Planctomycetota bacterium]
MKITKITIQKHKLSLEGCRKGGRGLTDLFPRVMKWCNNPRDKANYYFFEAIDRSPFLLGAIAIDIGPMAYGPFKQDNITFIEDIHNPNANHNVISRLIKEVIKFSKSKKCRHIRGQIDYKDKITLQAMRELGFAIVPIDDRKGRIRTNQYLVVKPLV